MLMLVIGLLSVYNVGPRVVSTHPHVRSVSAGEAADRAGVEANDVVVAVDGEPITFASQLRDAIARHPDQLITLSILRDGQPLMIRATPTRRANQGQLGIMIANETAELSHGVTWRYLWLQTMAGLMVAGTLGLLSALAARGGIVLRLMSIAVVDEEWNTCVRIEDTVAGRFELVAGAGSVRRSVRRSFAALDAHPAGRAESWSSVPWACRSSSQTNHRSPSSDWRSSRLLWPCSRSLRSVALIRPERGLQDRLAGTWLVPR